MLKRKEKQNAPVLVGAFVYEELARRHHFNDANKRTSHGFAKVMLFLMGLHFKIEYDEAVKFIIEIAKHKSKVTLEEIEKWISSHVVPVEDKNLEEYLKEVVLDFVKHGKEN